MTSLIQPAQISNQLPTNNQKTLSEIEQFYSQTQQIGKFHGLVVADKGQGKTTLIATLPKPIFIMSMSPGGTQTIRDLIAERKVIVDTRYEQDDMDNPVAYMNFYKNFNEMRKSGFLSNFASFAIDGLTEMGRSMMWYLVKRDGRAYPSIGDITPVNRERHGPTFNTWDVVLNNMVSLTNQVCSLPMHTVITAHIERDKDELLQTYVKFIFFPGQSKHQVPMRIPEIYYIVTKKVDGKDRRILLTTNTGEYQASTRMGTKGKILPEEPFNEGEQTLQNLIKKCGLDWQDRGDGTIKELI